MRGITIVLNGKSVHTGNDLDLVQEEKDLGKPRVQSYTVEVPGRHGLLNLTKGLTGEVVYSNRTLRFQYFGSGKRSDLLELDAAFSQYHGETVQIIDDDYPEDYFEGEVEVSTKIHGNYITIQLTVNAQPFRFARTETKVTRAVSSDFNIVYQIDNPGVSVVPTVTVTGEVKVTMNNVSYTLSAGTYISEELTLRRGLNAFTLSGDGTISFSYRRRDI